MDQERVLREVFGHDRFRPLQKKAVEASVTGRDLVMVLPTGGGKSLCYQLPALMREGVTVVVSPLLALMHDQVRALKLQGVAAEMLGSMQSPEERAETLRKLERGEVKLLYVAPERLLSPAFEGILARLPVAGFVIDEAHCVSEWGHEFRDDYRRLGFLKERWPDVPVSAFTATATPEVEEDIVRQLRLREPVRLRGSVTRENLFIRAEPRVGDGKAQLKAFLETFANESGIVYTFTRNAAENVAAWLQREGIDAVAYHAGLEASMRQAAYHAFVHDEVKVVVATVAFGMGIDKPDIRFVVHMSMPKTLENYYQEIGRAGRDGLPCETLLLYSAADAAQRASLLEQLEEGPYKQSAWEKLEKMTGFCRGEGCRHAALAAYFGEEGEACETRCDNCTATEREKSDITEAARKFLSALYRTGQRFGKGHLIDILRGAKTQKIEQFGHDRLTVYGIGKELSKAQWEAVVERLMELGALRRGEHRNLCITPAGVAVLKGETSVTIRSERMQVREKKPRPLRTPVSDMGYDQAIFDKLRALRREIAAKEGVPAYMVFGDRSLMEMASSLPESEEAMLKIGGVGRKKMERYGEAFLQVIKECADGGMQ
ncbi:DNA helicase RecQ [Hydrogenimonas sp. SS33]|uniref:DNA helicase RecQ n=1 Tax=Hydrogenimonas leucolamina TaxID=2954236 RepID=UPI00336BC82C